MSARDRSAASGHRRWLLAGSAVLVAVLAGAWFAYPSRMEIAAAIRGCHYENLPTHFQGEHWVWGRLDYRATKADVANGLRWHERLTVGSRRYQSLYGAEAWVVIRDRYWGGKMYMDLPTRHDGWGTVYRGQPRQGITVCGKRYVEWPNGNRTYPTITTHFKPYFAPTTTTTATTGTPT